MNSRMKHCIVGMCILSHWLNEFSVVGCGGGGDGMCVWGGGVKMSVCRIFEMQVTLSWF